MNIQSPFGLVTGCHAGDEYMVQATLASMRHYCPAIPICLVVDGAFDVSDLEKAYDLIVLRVADLPSAEMRRMIGNNFRAKLAAMWEGPFDYYIWLDSDAVMWGDVVSYVDISNDFQIFWKENAQIQPPETRPQLGEVPEGLRHYYFDPIRLRKFDSKFEWEGCNYFCSGAFACRRNAITFAEWAEVEKWAAREPGMFAWGEMGMLNYLVHSKAQRGEIRISSSDLQHVWVHHGKGELLDDCRNCGWQFPKVIARPRVAHFCGRKPSVLDPRAYSRPFTIARLAHYRRRGCLLYAWAHVVYEDLLSLWKRLRRRLAA